MRVIQKCGMHYISPLLVVILFDRHLVKIYSFVNFNVHLLIKRMLSVFRLLCFGCSALSTILRWNVLSSGYKIAVLFMFLSGRKMNAGVIAEAKKDLC